MEHFMLSATFASRNNEDAEKVAQQVRDLIESFRAEGLVVNPQTSVERDWLEVSAPVRPLRTASNQLVIEGPPDEELF